METIRDKQKPDTFKECESLECENCYYYRDGLHYLDYHLLCEMPSVLLGKDRLKKITEE